jgi:serine/threonine-protein kinase
VQPGDVLSRKYRLLRRIAEGGMGEVWVARNERTQRDFALKVLLGTLSQNVEAMRRFAQEARATGRLRHPGIVEVFDAGKTLDGRPYLVLELLDGECLADRLVRVGRLSELETCVLLSQAAAAVAHAHEAGVIHRDLSAANVFLAKAPDPHGEVPKILDFGVSKLDDGSLSGTLIGALLGSPSYMSPEQAEGAENVDERTDVWSLGVLLYQCLTGRVPFNGRNQNATMIAVLTKTHRPLLEVAPKTDPELAALVEACLVKPREGRLASALELASRLRGIALRLAPGDARVVPRRRAGDRLPRVAARSRFEFGAGSWIALRALVGLGLRAPGPIAAACGLVGIALGFVGGVHFERRAVPGQGGHEEVAGRAALAPRAAERARAVPAPEPETQPETEAGAAVSPREVSRLTLKNVRP